MEFRVLLLYLVGRDLDSLVRDVLQVLRVEVREADVPDLALRFHVLEVVQGVQVVGDVVRPPVELTQSK